ncbi:TIGR03643 family protein [Aliarcobacter butzleri]|uniref:TIGR03643 family protein n=1 Tax=Aliarcobacter butzleri TaxID=28197 RepID=UPI00263E532F|nr:TIGR03643 family protein [Aliarcobacter butzleri]MDN5105103.1 TIGR03643 family protein [Aliarcobacter butzleri]
MYFQKDCARNFNLNKKKKNKQSDLSFSETDQNRLVEMVWQDRVSFDTIKELYGFTENELKKMMRNLLKKSSFKMWRKRVQGRITKHKLKVSYKTTRFQ